MALSGDNKTSGHQFIPFSLRDLIRLTGQKRFVYLHFPGRHNSIRTDLIAGFENDNIIKHKFFRIDHRFLSVTHNHCMRCIQHGQLIKNLFRTHLLNNTDQCVGDNDRKKSQIPEGSHQYQKNGKYCKDQVEICKYILMDDLFCCL